VAIYWKLLFYGNCNLYQGNDLDNAKSTIILPFDYLKFPKWRLILVPVLVSNGNRNQLYRASNAIYQPETAWDNYS